MTDLWLTPVHELGTALRFQPYLKKKFKKKGIDSSIGKQLVCDFLGCIHPAFYMSLERRNLVDTPKALRKELRYERGEAAILVKSRCRLIMCVDWIFLFMFPCVQEENIDLEELEQFAKNFKRRRIELGESNLLLKVSFSLFVCLTETVVLLVSVHQ